VPFVPSASHPRRIGFDSAAALRTARGQTSSPGESHCVTRLSLAVVLLARALAICCKDPNSKLRKGDILKEVRMGTFSQSFDRHLLCR
jgi:hypothetical protein